MTYKHANPVPVAVNSVINLQPFHIAAQEIAAAHPALDRNKRTLPDELINVLAAAGEDDTNKLTTVK